MKLVLFILLMHGSAFATQVRIGTKNFTEGYLTGELIAQKLEQSGLAKPDRRFGLGSTGIVYEALKSGQIDMYVEYTGTIQEALLKAPGRLSFAELSRAAAAQNLTLGPRLGFNNSYALAVKRSFAEQNGLHTMSDLGRVAERTRFGITHEFFSRADGYGAMTEHYGYRVPRNQVTLMEHALLYPAIANGKVDVIEVYATDGKLQELDLQILEDDRHFFPAYEAVLLASTPFVKAQPELWRAISTEMAGAVTTEEMRTLNAEADLNKKSPREVIAAFLHRSAAGGDDGIWPRVVKRTKEHAILVGLAMAFCILIGVPLGLFGLSAPLLAQTILLASSVVQTIPSLALLCFLIPVFGIGQTPALVALFLYGLFPIVVNTYAGVSEVGRDHLENAKALGMSRLQQLLWIEIPLASPHILNGIKTSTILTIGTATLAALIGAGGYGAPIITGLAMNSTETIFIGAIPAATMAILAHGLFLLLSVMLVPKGLRH